MADDPDRAETQLAEYLARLDARRAEVNRYRPDGRLEWNESRLFELVKRILAEAARNARTERDPGRALWEAEQRAVLDDPDHAHVASLAIHSLTRGCGDPAVVEAAHELVIGDADDPRREQLRAALGRFARDEIPITSLDQITKGWIPLPRVEGTRVAENARPVVEARRVLEGMLADIPRTSLADVWPTYIAFLHVPFRAAPPLRIDNDMSLFEYGRSASDEGRVFCDLTRQFSFSDHDGSYDHMEQLRVTLVYADELAIGENAIWSGDDFDRWKAEVEASDAFHVLSSRSAAEMRVDFSPV